MGLSSLNTANIPTDPEELRKFTIAFIKGANPLIWTTFLCVGFCVGDSFTQAQRERNLLKNMRPATYCYFTIRIAKFTALVLFSLTIPLGGSHDTFANAGTKIYFFLEAIVYAAVKAVLLLRTLALYQSHTKTRAACLVSWLIASSFHFVNCWTFSATANPIPGLTIFIPVTRGGLLRVWPYFVSLAFETAMTVLTFYGSRRGTPLLTTQEMLRMQPSRGMMRVQRGELVASTIFRGQLLYMLCLLACTSVTGAMSCVSAVNGYYSLVPLPVGLTLTSASACNIILSLRLPATGIVEMDPAAPLAAAAAARTNLEMHHKGHFPGDTALPLDIESKDGSTRQLVMPVVGYEPATAPRSAHPFGAWPSARIPAPYGPDHPQQPESPQSVGGLPIVEEVALDGGIHIIRSQVTHVDDLRQ